MGLSITWVWLSIHLGVFINGCLPHLVPNCTQPREMGSGWCFHSALHITSTRNIIPVDYFLLVLDSCLKPATINKTSCWKVISWSNTFCLIAFLLPGLFQQFFFGVHPPLEKKEGLPAGGFRFHDPASLVSTCLKSYP